MQECIENNKKIGGLFYFFVIVEKVGVVSIEDKMREKSAKVVRTYELKIYIYYG